MFWWITYFKDLNLVAEMKRINLYVHILIIILAFLMVEFTKLATVIHEMGHSFVCTFFLKGVPKIKELPEGTETLCYYAKDERFLKLFFLSGILMELLIGILLSITQPISSFGGYFLYEIGKSFLDGCYVWDLTHAGIFLPPFAGYFFFSLGIGALFISIAYQTFWWLGDFKYSKEK